MPPLLQSQVPGYPCRRGKVRDVYDLGDRLVIVATDRISAFDWVLPTPIPDKGRLLTALTLFWLEYLGGPHHLLGTDLREMGPAFAERAAELEGRTCLVIDDLIDTAGTLVKTASALMENGATDVYACCSHPVFSGPAVENIAKSCIRQVVVTDTIPLTEAAKQEPKITVRTVAGLIGRAIQAIHEEASVSKLFL